MYLAIRQFPFPPAAVQHTKNTFTLIILELYLAAVYQLVSAVVLTPAKILSGPSLVAAAAAGAATSTDCQVEV